MIICAYCGTMFIEEIGLQIGHCFHQLINDISNKAHNLFQTTKANLTFQSPPFSIVKHVHKELEQPFIFLAGLHPAYAYFTLNKSLSVHGKPNIFVALLCMCGKADEVPGISLGPKS